MNTQFHTPSFGDEVFDLGDASTSTPTSSFISGNPVNHVNSSYMYQQETPPSVGRGLFSIRGVPFSLMFSVLHK